MITEGQKIIWAFGVINGVLAHYATDASELESHNKRPDLVFQRHLLMHLIRIGTGMTMERIGVLLNRHHTAVVYGLQRLQEVIETEPERAEEVKMWESRIKPLIK